MAKKNSKVPTFDYTKKFSFSDVEDFDKHISTQIRDYDRLFESILSIADSFILDGKRVYDIGCSTGFLIKTLSNKYASRKSEYVGIDINSNFSKLFIDTDNIKFHKADITRGYNFTDASLVLSLFTLQFIDPKDRLAVLDSIASSLDDGYGFIIAEKTYPDSAFAYKVLESASSDYKTDYYTDTEILADERSLRDIMRPFTEERLTSELKERFSSVSTIWAYYNFKAYLCIK